MTDHSISPRTGKPKQKQLGKSKLLLRERGRKIAVSLLKGKTQQEALIDAGYSPASARNASEILDNPVIREGYCEVLEQAGLTDVFAAKTHKNLMEATTTTQAGEYPDHMARARALDMYYKVRGRYIERKEISGKDGAPIKIQDMTDDELIAIIQRGSSKGT